jgi:ribonuclease D
MAQRRGREILQAIKRGLEVPDDQLPRFPRGVRPERDPELEARTERVKAVRNRRAEALDLDPGFLMGRALLEEVARHMPASREALLAVPGVRRWQVEALGDELLRAVQSS